MALLAQMQSWPNAVDAVVTTAFLIAVILLPATGYLMMAVDLRAYVRSLRRSVAVLGRYLPFEIPEWARPYTPRAIAALGLQMPCSEDELMRAYRRRVKQMHPDHGGDARRFLMLQANFEEALALVRGAAHSAASAPVKRPAA